MTALAKLKAETRRGAEAKLRPEWVREVRILPDVGSDGQEILRVLVVLSNEITDEELIDSLVEIKKRARDVGEERETVVSFATEEGLREADADPQS